MALRRVRIVSNGTNRGTMITDADTGEVLPDIYELKIEMSGGPSEHARVQLLAAVEFELEADADVRLLRFNPKTHERTEIHPVSREDIEAAYLRFMELADAAGLPTDRQSFYQAVYGLLEQHSVLTKKE